MCKRVKTATAGDFIERTILGTVSVLKEIVSSDTVASRKGFLQACDPRIKCLCVALLLCVTILSRSKLELAALYGGTVLLAMASSIRIDFYLKRTLLFIPLFSLFIVLPAIFSSVTPGMPLVTFHLFHHEFSITRQGIDSAIIFFLRVLASVSFAVLLVLTTRQQTLLKALRYFRTPQLFVMTVGMCYRYIFLLLDIVQQTFVAIKSRVGYVTSSKTGRRVVAANMGGLWLKSYLLQTQVYSAMLSRGYSGEPKVLDEFRSRPIDYIILTTALAALIGTLWLNRFLR